MELYATPGNDIPAGAAVETARAADGVRLRVARWGPTRDPVVGTLLVLQGRAEMIEKYFETVRDFTARGFHVATFDWRGQGGSDRTLQNPRPGHVSDFAEYEADLSAVVAALAPACPKPWFALAHSMGGCVALSALRRGTLPVERLAATAPMIAIHGIAYPTGVLWLARALRLIGLGGRYIPGGGATSIATKPFADNPLTADPARYARNARIASDHPALAIGDPTIGWTRAAFARMREFAQPRYLDGIATPMLMLAAGADTVVSTPAIAAFAQGMKAGGAIVIPGARHELLMERDAIRAQLFAALDAFLPGSGAEAAPAASGRKNP